MKTVFVVGAGPAGLFAAQKIALGGHQVVVFNRDIKPGGLAEYGIYPVKDKMKTGLRKQFGKMLSQPNLHYIGNVAVGGEQAVTLDALREFAPTALVCAVGAQGTKKLGLEGEDSLGVYSAKDFVYHYNLLPPFSSQDFSTGKRVAIVGMGNVMVDIARWLLIDDPDRKTEEVIVVARRGSPIVLGIGKDEAFAASDVSALAQHTDQVVYLEENEVARIERGKFAITTLENRSVTRGTTALEFGPEAAARGKFPHYMLKEIFEQPEAVENALRGRVNHSEGVAKLGGLESVLDGLQKARHLIIISCGTSYYAGLFARYVFEALTDLTVETELASEFRYRKLNLRQNTVVLAISQSGETADTLAALREAKRKGALVLGLVNVVGSSIARETQAGVYSHAGIEIGVASTKSFTSQLTILTLMALLIGRSRDLSYEEGNMILRGLEMIPDQMREILKQVDHINELAHKYSQAEHFLYIGRKYQYPIALEGALKLKEIAYIHAEGYAAGEMKHGPIALIDPTFPTMAVVPEDNSYEKTVSNVQEIRARDGHIIAVTTEGNNKLGSLVDDVIYVPPSIDLVMPLLTVIPLQLFAYHCAVLRGCDVDKPRNLAKSVTVE